MKQKSNESPLEKQLNPIPDSPQVTISQKVNNGVGYRTLSINVTDTLSHGVEATKGHVKDIAELDWHTLSVEETLQRLGCLQAQGLDSNQAQRRLQQNGKNVLSPPPTHRFRKMYFNLDHFW
jgi:hypothetical protein